MPQSKPHYPRYPKDYLADTGHLDLESHGLYSLALDYLWLNNGYLSIKKFQKILKISDKKFTKKWQKISDFFSISGDEFCQKRLLHELEKYNKKCKKNAENAKLGAHSRWNNTKQNMPNGIANGIANGKKNNAVLLKQKAESRKQKAEYNIYKEKFEKFWSVYPKRNGKVVGKKQAFSNFLKLRLFDCDRVISNAKNYGIDNDYPKDPERFLKNEFWKEWDTPMRKETEDEKRSREIRELEKKLHKDGVA